MDDPPFISDFLFAKSRMIARLSKNSRWLFPLLPNYRSQRSFVVCCNARLSDRIHFIFFFSCGHLNIYPVTDPPLSARLIACKYVLIKRGLGLWCLIPLYTIFQLYIVAVSFIGAGNWSILRNPQTCCK
jgi:hypothetical protein